MSTSYLLDSSVLVLSLQHDPIIVQRLVGKIGLYASTISLGELYYGAEHSHPAYREMNLAEVDKLTNSMTILIVDSATARIYGRIKQEQRIKGRIIPENDLWIASIAIQYDLTLVARDKHFSWIDGLALEQW